MLNLSSRHRKNIAILITLLDTKVTDEQYDHNYMLPTLLGNDSGNVCASGHAYLNRGLFIITETEAPQSRWKRWLRITPTLVPTYYAAIDNGGYTCPTEVYRFAKDAFGVWDSAFNFPSYRTTEDYGDPVNVTRQMVIDRLRAILDGSYKPK